LTKQLSQDLGRFGITTNAVAPGFVRSNPTTERQWQSYGPESQKRLVDGIHTRRLGQATDIANAVLFLASDQASWISGQILSVDGGQSYTEKPNCPRSGALDSISMKRVARSGAAARAQTAAV
jgi:3-oxoacyl-[acyl-carrier protein] reductase